MAHIVLVTGGCRSGKSRWALERAERAGSRRIFLATCRPEDDEMRERIARHRRERDRSGWMTLESPLDPAATLGEAPPSDALLIDCLTLWISNLMEEARQSQTPGRLSEDDVDRISRRLLEAGRSRDGCVIMVSNEVGCGTVPMHATARLFRDLLGRCNQVMAAEADEMIWMVAGQPVRLDRESGS